MPTPCCPRLCPHVLPPKDGTCQAPRGGGVGRRKYHLEPCPSPDRLSSWDKVAGLPGFSYPRNLGPEPSPCPWWLAVCLWSDH